jgi:hypothetical protein
MTGNHGFQAPDFTAPVSAMSFSAAAIAAVASMPLICKEAD